MNYTGAGIASCGRGRRRTKHEPPKAARQLRECQ